MPALLNFLPLTVFVMFQLVFLFIVRIGCLWRSCRFQQPSLIAHSSVFWHVWTINRQFQKVMTVLQVYITELLCNLDFAGVKGYCAKCAILFCKICIKFELAYALPPQTVVNRS
jgi:hypothetical protein